ncbi:hypothetical protein SAMD00019534_015110 [Acytostelium subglobosum LB1]|uniref:hypothetical protein n=1 Tax=Acytostelium subglobosum LB1 TaxID=1410327 RepID=UPI000644E4D2|nr:hypothetical protein SAMD00019534_015110 [Acytostelium subglobosum LB1]GAM18336.1 hypothetical protein SAMD00019534_015110 [Acytostelium subglobosum LB1]|eukprot:XP_012757556.1 hypothetical protein SAMD00019534_015110 [Acytostelium subglobosum LB1]
MTYEQWRQSKQAIKNICGNFESIPTNLRYLIWRHIVCHDNLNTNQMVVPCLSGSSAAALNDSFNSLIGTVQLDSGVNIDLTRSNDSTSSVGNASLSSSSASYNPTPIFHNDMLNRDCLQLTNDYSLFDQIRQLIKRDCMLSRGHVVDELPQSILLDTLDAEMISERLQRFVRNFCMATSREYSIHVAQLIIPFVVQSFSDEIVSNLERPNDKQNSEEDWMSLSIKIVENLSLSGLLPFRSAHPILQCESEMFRILLLFHDPALSYFFEQRTVFTTLYFYNWINHMLCGCADLLALVQLWDILLFHDHQDFYLFFTLSLLTSNREHILSINGGSKDILSTLQECDLFSQAKLPMLIKKASDMRKITPISFINSWSKLFTNCKHPKGPRLDMITQTYNEFKYSICMAIDVEEMILMSKYGLHPGVREKLKYYQHGGWKDANLVVLDCRPYRYFKSGKFPDSYHLPPGLLIDRPDEWQDMIKKTHSSGKGVSHFAFYDNWSQQVSNPLFDKEKNEADTNDNGDMNMNILRFLKEGFPYVSRVPSGYKKIHDLFLSKGFELNCHDPTLCPVCNPNIQYTSLQQSPTMSPQQQTPAQQITPSKRERFFNMLKIGSRSSVQLPKEQVNNNNMNNNNSSLINSPNHNNINNNNNYNSNNLNNSREDISPLRKPNPLRQTVHLSDLSIGSSGSRGGSRGSRTEKNKSMLSTSMVDLNDLFDHDPRLLELEVAIKRIAAPIIVDSDEEDEADGYDDFRHNPRFYYMSTLADVDDEGGHYYRDYNMTAVKMPVYEPNKEKLAIEQMEKSLAEYKGLEEWLEGDHFIFECAELTDDVVNLKCYAVISKDQFLVLKEHPKCSGYVKVDSKYNLANVGFNEHNPAILELITNHNGVAIGGNELQPSGKRQYLFPDIDTITSIQTKIKSHQ